MNQPSAEERQRQSDKETADSFLSAYNAGHLNLADELFPLPDLSGADLAPGNSTATMDGGRETSPDTVRTWGLGDPNAPKGSGLEVTTTFAGGGNGYYRAEAEKRDLEAVRRGERTYDDLGLGAPLPERTSLVTLTRGFLEGVGTGFFGATEAAGSWLADQAWAFKDNGISGTVLGRAYNGAVQFTSNEMTLASEGGFANTRTGAFLNTTADFVGYLGERGISENLAGAQGFTSNLIEASANYYNGRSANQLAFDLGNFTGEQAPALILTAGSGTAFKVGAEAFDAGIAGLKSVGGLLNDVRFVGSADGYFANQIGAVGAEARAAERLGITSTEAAGALRSGQLHEAEQLAKLGVEKGTNVFRPSAAEIETATFKAMVGDAQYTKGGQLKGTIFDSTSNGYLEIKGGASTLNSTYQLRLQTYKSVIDNQPFTLQTTRPVNPAFSNYLDFWGVNVVKPGN